MIYNFIRKLLTYKTVFARPKKCRILIYSSFYKDVLLKIVDANSSEILDFKEINLFVLFITLIQFKFKNVDYIDTYIKCSAPKILITAQDDDINFYKLKMRHKNVITIAIQYGIRTQTTWILFEKDKDDEIIKEIDHLIVFSEFEKFKYEKYILINNYYTFGSIINNAIPDKWEKNDDVIYISQLRLNFKENPILFSLNNKSIFHNDFYRIDKELLPIVDKFCGENNYNLVICGSSKADNENEYFQSIIGHDKYRFENRKELSSYKLISKSCIVISVDSTLGYESFARKIPTAFFPARDKYIKEDGWKSSHSYYSLPKHFWTDSIDSRKVSDILSVLSQISEENFYQLWNNFHDKIMCYDSNNNKLRALILSLSN